MVDGRAKVFIGLGGNFVRAVPDWTVAEAAMRRLRLTVAVSTNSIAAIWFMAKRR
jgi:formate dehydrogenase major subunit